MTKRTPKAGAGIVITNVKTKRKPSKVDPYDAVLADPLIGPLLERSALKEHFWGRLSDITPAEALLEEVQRTHALLLWHEYELEAAGGLASMGTAKPDRWVVELSFDDEHPQQEWAGRQVEAYRNACIVKALAGSYQMTREHLVDATVRAEKSRLAERMVSLNEAKAHMVFLVIQSVFQDPRLALTPAQLACLPGLMRTHVTSIVNANAAITAARTEKVPA